VSDLPTAKSIALRPSSAFQFGPCTEQLWKLRNDCIDHFRRLSKQPNHSMVESLDVYLDGTTALEASECRASRKQLPSVLMCLEWLFSYIYTLGFIYISPNPLDYLPRFISGINIAAQLFCLALLLQMILTTFPTPTFIYPDSTCHLRILP
jgi:hypothetical protein